MKTVALFKIAVLAWTFATPLRAGNTDTNPGSQNNDGYIQWKENGHFYKAVYAPQGISWSQAKIRAEREEGYLATITSSKENEFVFSLIDKKRFWHPYVTEYGNEYIGPWIGGCQEEGAREPDGGWKWVTGEEFEYEKWASTEPFGYWNGRNENRLHYYSLGKRRRYWGDLPDSVWEFSVLGYVIEKTGLKTEAPHPATVSPRTEFNTWIGSRDFNDDGMVSRKEFLAGTKKARARKGKPYDPEKAANYFAQLDKNNDGFITPSEEPRPKR